MNEQSYIALINTYGTHPSRWPEDQRVAGLSFIANNFETVQILNTENFDLDQQLDVYQEHIMAGDQSRHAQTANTRPMALMDKILAQARQTPQETLDHGKNNFRSTTLQSDQKRIQNPANDHPTQFLADDGPRFIFGSWASIRKVAAMVIMVAGLGFIGVQNKIATSKASDEALYQAYLNIIEQTQQNEANYLQNASLSIDADDFSDFAPFTLSDTETVDLVGDLDNDALYEYEAEL